MDIKTCRFCRKTHRGFGVLCAACVEQMDKKYLTVRNYLDRNTEANICNVAKETDVDEKSILYLIREGRISLRGATSAIRCLKCGTDISSGKYCDKCKGGLVRALETTRSEMESVLKPAQPKPSVSTENKSKIHILKDE